MPDVIALKDGRVETLFEVRHFEELIDKYMGWDALRYFRELLSGYETEIEERKVARSETEKFVLKDMLPSIDCNDPLRQEWIEKFQSKMEELYYGLE